MSDTNDKWKQKELGVLYKQKSKDGTKEFLSGTINGKKVVVFSNKKYKDGRIKDAQGEEEAEKARRIPDFTIYESEELNGGNGGGGARGGSNQRSGGYNNNRSQGAPSRQGGGGSGFRSNPTQRRQSPPPVQADGQDPQDPLGSDVAY